MSETRAPSAARSSERSDRRLHQAIFVATAVLLALAPLAVYPVFVMKALCFALFATAFNLLLGFGGLLSFGHAAYFGVASYVAAYTAARWGMPPEGALLLATISAALLGAAFGALAIRRQGIYFAMITLALAQMVYFLSLQNPSLTGGEDGIQGVPRGVLLGLVDLADDRALYVVVSSVFLLALAGVYRIIHSPFGEVCTAIRDNETRARSLGFDVDRYKLLLFVLSAALAGLAGALKAIVFQLATLTDVHWSMSGEAVLMSIVGGIGTIFGPVVGAFVIVAMQNYLVALGGWVVVVQGAIFVACVLLFRAGLVGTIARRTGRSL